jgi:RND superfamily putative drug exporter
VFARWSMVATALGGGNLLDATLVRGVLAPAAVAILGRWNWWLPRRPARMLRVAPSEGRSRQPLEAYGSSPRSARA